MGNRIFTMALGVLGVFLLIVPAQAWQSQKSTVPHTSQSQQQEQQRQQALKQQELQRQQVLKQQQEQQRLQKQQQQQQQQSKGSGALNQAKDIAGQGPRVKDGRYHGELFDTPNPNRSVDPVRNPQVKPTPTPPTPQRPSSFKDNNYDRTGNPIYKSLKPSPVPPPQ